jgi:hypothetical protein
MDHAKAIEAVAKWLRVDKYVVLIEPQASFFATGERPDILAYSTVDQLSVVVEVKVSQADLAANKHKSGLGLGNRRYWATLPGLKVPDDDWGWLIVHPDGEVVEVREAYPHDLPAFFLARERHLFAAALGAAAPAPTGSRHARVGDAAKRRWFESVAEYVKTWDTGNGLPLHEVQKALTDIRPVEIKSGVTANEWLMKAAEKGDIPGVEMFRKHKTRMLRARR